MFNTQKDYRAERARRKIISQGVKKSRFRKWRVLVIVATVLMLSAVVYAICFAFRTPIVPHTLSRGKIVPVQIVSPFDFSYTSEVQTQRNRDRSAERITPIYKTNLSTISRAGENAKKIKTILDNTQEEYNSLSSSENNDENFLEKISSEIKRSTLIDISPYDLQTLYKSFASREEAFNQVFFHAINILRDGIYQDGDPIFSHTEEQPKVDILGGISAPRALGEIGTSGGSLNGIGNRYVRAVSESDARKELLDKVKTLGMNNALAMSLYRVANQALVPNIEFDEQKTQLKREEARNKVKPVVIKIREGEILIDSETLPSPLVAEKLKAYRNECFLRNESFSSSTKSVDAIFCLLIVMSGAFFIAVSRAPKNKHPKTIAIFCALLIINLVLERALVWFCSAEYFDPNTPLLQILMYVAPIMLGPIMMVLLFGSYTGFIMAIMISALTTNMVSEGIVYFMTFFSAALVAIYFCATAKTRWSVVVGGVIYGSIIALISLIIGLCINIPIEISIWQAILSISSGLVMGVVAIGILPILEALSGRYSNITLSDYTNFNNALLRRLQVEAPGTYHHSVMVSHIAESAALAVKANAMLCRVGSLYHDIGKLQKPEFYTENQGGGKNAHDDQNPSMSALIIKNHIREGEEIAKIARLPKQIIDIIGQHHGTTIISYFYRKAVKLAEANGNANDPVQALRDAGLDESVFRYDGPKPQSLESAIIMIADSCEAASRSLTRVTKHGLEELVNNIVNSKINDGQFDECPITVKQISQLKESIVYTMLTMLHTRVAYEKDEKKDGK